MKGEEGREGREGEKERERESKCVRGSTQPQIIPLWRSKQRYRDKDRERERDEMER